MKFPLLAVAVFLYCAWNALDLVDLFLINDWRIAPAVSLSIWLLSGVIYIYLMRKIPYHTNYILVIIALISSLLGTLGSLHIFQHIGFACAYAALLPWTKGVIPWLMGAISWMPSLQWLGSFVGLGIMTPLRISLALLAAIWLIVFAKKYEAINES